MTASTLEDLAARIDRLESRAEIENVIGRLARAQDRMDIEAIGACYHRPDGFDDHLVFKGSGDAFARWFVEVCAPLEETLHFVGPSVVEVDGDVAQAQTECVAHHFARLPAPSGSPAERPLRSDWIMGLRYLDRLERRGGKWLIAHRKCIYDWTYHSGFEGALRTLDDPNIVWGRRDREDGSYFPVGPSPLA
ncbi:MAG TPA: nuclear transport factor 2 family protein [Novosphingobium sp.]|nr:nuclear transport factor 2 family protein [Novosphingobium sp.]